MTAPNDMTPEMQRDMWAGRLEQACPCGRWEAAHRYCSLCLRVMGPADWYRNGDMARRIAVVGPARAAEKARPKRQRGPRNAQTPVNGTDDADVPVTGPHTHPASALREGGPSGPVTEAPGLVGPPSGAPGDPRSVDIEPRTAGTPTPTSFGF